MEEDSKSVWLVVRSNDGLFSDDISNRIGIPSNSRVKNHPQGGKTFFLKSEVSIKDTQPLIDHIDWMVSTCSTHFESLRNFLSEPENSGEIFIYIFTEHDAGYAELTAKQLRLFVECGLSLSVKIETNSESKVL